jgi:hypothetical protein
VPVAALVVLFWLFEADMSLLVLLGCALELAEFIEFEADILLEMSVEAAVVEDDGVPDRLELLLWHLSEIMRTSVTLMVCCAPLVVSLPELPLEPLVADELALPCVPVTSTVCPTCACSCESLPDRLIVRPD